MNITLISTRDRGGAGIAAYRLLRGLNAGGQAARMVVWKKERPDPEILQVTCADPLAELEQDIFHRILETEIIYNRSSLSDTWFSFPYPGVDLSALPPLIKTDLINLHWTADFQSVESLAALMNTKKPLVWTLHDENAFTGGCHYTAGCALFEQDCAPCPQLQNDHLHLPALNLQNKLALWRNHPDRLMLVSPSRWLAGRARRSRLFQGFRIEVIPNGIETDIFQPLEREKTRRSLGIPPDARCLLFAAESDSARRKGLDHLFDALRLLSETPQARRWLDEGRLYLLTFGGAFPRLKEVGIPLIASGFIENQRRLAALYAAADLFVLPALEDNLPNTVLEAMACGTPAVCFDAGGTPEMIADGLTGKIVQQIDAGALSQAILALLSGADGLAAMRSACRERAQALYSLPIQAAAYTRLFHELADRYPSPLEETSYHSGPALPTIWKRHLPAQGETSPLAAPTGPIPVLLAQPEYQKLITRQRLRQRIVRQYRCYIKRWLPHAIEWRLRLLVHRLEHFFS